MSFEKTPVGLLSRVLRSREQDDGAVVATLGSRWFEMVCASCSLAVLQMAIGSPDSYHDDQQVTASEAMAESRALYLQSNLLIARLRGGNLALPWDVPKRVDGESEVDRRAAIKQLVSARFLVPESGSDIECFRIHRNRRQELAAELGIDVSEANN
jgi:hypothetical protein